MLEASPFPFLRLSVDRLDIFFSVVRNWVGVQEGKIYYLHYDHRPQPLYKRVRTSLLVRLLRPMRKTAVANLDYDLSQKI